MSSPDPVEAVIAEVELILRKHLPVKVADGGPVLCICDVTQTYDGPVAHRLHAAAALRSHGLVLGPDQVAVNREDVREAIHIIRGDSGVFPVMLLERWRSALEAGKQ